LDLELVEVRGIYASGGDLVQEFFMSDWNCLVSDTTHPKQQGSVKSCNWVEAEDATISQSSVNFFDFAAQFFIILFSGSIQYLAKVSYASYNYWILLYARMTLLKCFITPA
jgi:hypothetical protein